MRFSFFQGSASSYDWVVVAILYFVPMQNARFNSRTFADRTLQTDTGFYQQGIAGIPTEDAAIDATSSEVSLTRLYADPGKYMGKEVEVVCHRLCRINGYPMT